MAASQSDAQVHYSDRTTWETAVPGSPNIFEDFNGAAVQNLGTPVVFPDLTVQAFEVGGPNSSIATGLTDIDGTAHVRFTLENTADPETGTITFNSPVYAIGFDVANNVHLGAQVNLMTDAGETASYTTPVNNTLVEFHGFVFNQPFTTITFSADSGNAPHGIDNLAAFCDHAGGYSDRNAWEAALGGPPHKFEDFNSAAVQNLGTPVVFPDLTVQAFEVGGPNSSIATGLTDIDGTAHVRFTLENTADPETGTITFNSPVYAIGFDVANNVHLGAQVNLMTDAGETASYTTPVNNSLVEFHGFVFNQPFTTITFSADSSNAPHGIDNLAAYCLLTVGVESSSWGEVKGLFR